MYNMDKIYKTINANSSLTHFYLYLNLKSINNLKVLWYSKAMCNSYSKGFENQSKITSWTSLWDIVLWRKTVSDFKKKSMVRNGGITAEKNLILHVRHFVMKLFLFIQQTATNTMLLIREQNFTSCLKFYFLFENLTITI